MSFINDTRWDTILTKLNQKRTDGGFSPVSSVFSGYLKQSNIDTLRNGTNDILTKYQYTDLSDALNNVGYAYDIWKSWDYNFIATRSLDEIEDILDTMWYTAGRKEYLEDLNFSFDESSSFVSGSDDGNFPWITHQPRWYFPAVPSWTSVALGNFRIDQVVLGGTSPYDLRKYSCAGSYNIGISCSFVKITDNEYNIVWEFSWNASGQITVFPPPPYGWKIRFHVYTEPYQCPGARTVGSYVLNGWDTYNAVQNSGSYINTETVPVSTNYHDYNEEWGHN